MGKMRGVCARGLEAAVAGAGVATVGWCGSAFAAGEGSWSQGAVAAGLGALAALGVVWCVGVVRTRTRKSLSAEIARAERRV